MVRFESGTLLRLSGAYKAILVEYILINVYVLRKSRQVLQVSMPLRGCGALMLQKEACGILWLSCKPSLQLVCGGLMFTNLTLIYLFSEESNEVNLCENVFANMKLSGPSLLVSPASKE